MLDLTAFRRGAASLADLLPYIFLVDEGVAALKDGSLMAAWEFRGRDTASSTREELAHVAEQVNQALMSLDSGWMMQVDAVRSPATAYPAPELSHFPDTISAMIDEERRRFFSKSTCFETRTVLTLTFKPSYSATAAMLGDRQSFEKALARFNQDILNFESILGGVLELSRLSEYEGTDGYGNTQLYSDLLSHIQECLTGQLQPVMAPTDCAMFLDNLLGSCDLIGGLEPRLGVHEIAAISIDGFPEHSWPAILDVLSNLPLSYRFNLRFIFKDQQEAIAEVENKRKEWAQKKLNVFDNYFNNPSARANRDAVYMEEDAERAKARAQSGDVGFGKLTSTVVLLHEDRETLHECARYVQNILRNRLGFGSRVETYNALEAWRGTLPGEGVSNLRDALISTRNLSHLMPLASVWPGSSFCPCPFYPPNSPPLMVCTTGGSTPFRFNLHTGDLGHTLILGPTGAGKSTFLSLLCAQFRRYKGAQIFVFDKGMSIFPLCAAIGGSHYDIGGDGSQLAFAPLRHIDSDGDLAWAADWLGGLLEIQGNVPLNAEEREVVSVTLQKLRANPPDERTLYHYMNLLSYSSEGRLRSGLSQFCGEGPMARFMDASRDNFGLSDFIVFEIEELMKLGDHNAVPILLYLFHRIEKSLDGRPSIVVVDEAWRMFGHPACRAMILEWLKEMRKRNCAVVMATQSLSDAAKSGILDVVAESCPTKIYLANHAAENETQIALYQAMGLNSTQIQIIAHGAEKRDYYVEARGVGRRQMQLALKECPRTLALVGASGKEDIAMIKNLVSRYGNDWVERWFAFKKV